MQKAKWIILATLLLSAIAYSQAGASPSGNMPHRGGFGRGLGPARRLAPRPWKVVTNAPYSATVTEHFTRTLSNSGTISRTTTGQVARDSAGRTYVQQTITGGPLASSSGRTSVIFITDPVAGYSYTLYPERNVAVRRVFRAPQFNGRSFEPGNRPRRNRPNVVETELPADTTAIPGLSLEGRRVTRTIPAGTIGNSQAISSSSETWYSPDLQIVIRSSHDDPRFGQSTYALSNISQNEPDAALFVVPSGYAVRDARANRPRRESRR